MDVPNRNDTSEKEGIKSFLLEMRGASGRKNVR